MTAESNKRPLRRALVSVYDKTGLDELARGLHEVPVADRTFVPVNEEAHLIVDWVPLDQAVSLVLAGELHNGVAVVGLLAAHIAQRSGFAGLRDADAPER